MNAAPLREHTVTAVSNSDACQRCGTAPGAQTLLTSMTRYYVCGTCAARWSVPRNWLPSSMKPPA